MKHLLLYAIFFLLSCASSNKQKTITTEIFEGVITYDISYTQTSEYFRTDSLLYTLGNKELMYFQGGDYLIKRFSKDGHLLREYYFNLDSLKSYYKDFNSDTIRYQDKSIRDTKASFTILKDTLILGYNVTKIHAAIDVEDIYGDRIQVGSFNYYAKDLKLNPQKYHNYLEGDYNKLVKMAPGILLMSRADHVVWIENKKAIKVEERKVKKSEISFAIPRNTMLKEL